MNDHIEKQAQFLLDRLEEYDPEDEDHVRDFHGHVAPAIARLRKSLAATPAVGGGASDVLVKALKQIAGNEFLCPEAAECARAALAATPAVGGELADSIDCANLVTLHHWNAMKGWNDETELTDEDQTLIAAALRAQPASPSPAVGGAYEMALADKLVKLCCSETEKQFFDCVTDNIVCIIDSLRAKPATPAVGGEAPDWLWYGEDVNGNPVVTFGRWPKNGAKWRYKLAEIQPTEHDHPELPKRPFAFAVLRAPENGPDQWRLFMDEGEAREAAEQLDGDYEGLYRVGDRRSALYAAQPASPLRGSGELREALEAVAAHMSKDVQSGDSDLWTDEYDELHCTVIAALAASPPEQPAADPEKKTS